MSKEGTIPPGATAVALKISEDPKNCDNNAAEARPLALWIGSKMPWMMLVLGTFMLLGGGYLVMMQNVSAMLWSIPFAGMISALTGGIVLQRSRQPIFELTAENLTSTWLPQPLPLNTITEVSLVSMESGVTIHLRIVDGYQPAMTTKRFMKPIRFNPKRRTVSIIVPGKLHRFEGRKKIWLDSQQILALVGRYVTCAHSFHRGVSAPANQKARYYPALPE